MQSFVASRFIGLTFVLFFHYETGTAMNTLDTKDFITEMRNIGGLLTNQNVTNTRFKRDSAESRLLDLSTLKQNRLFKIIAGVLSNLGNFKSLGDADPYDYNMMTKLYYINWANILFPENKRKDKYPDN